MILRINKIYEYVRVCKALLSTFVSANHMHAFILVKTETDVSNILHVLLQSNLIINWLSIY